MKILVIGAGAWGTALAVSASLKTVSGQAAHEVSLWARNAALVEAVQSTRQNQRYLPGITLASGLQMLGGSDASLEAALVGQDLIVIATPIAGVRSVFQRLQQARVRVPVAWLSKGFEAPLAAVAGTAPAALPGVGLLVHEILAQVAPDLLAGVLSGPSFAREVAAGQPTALVAASEHADVRAALVDAFHSDTLRVYASDDIVGVEVGGAVKNVLAIATGFCDGLKLGLNARAALITRGLAEMSRLGVALGAQNETFTGLSGLGDLVLTATGDLSRNRQVGLLLAQGQTLAQAVASLGHVAEGAYCARTVVQRAQALGIEMPISEAVVALLDGEVTPVQAVASLMERHATVEQG
ncbi:MAG: NAD(P)H-dependent glycerol-3-phosphate dehydrogenase [Polaromonas sp.]|nr:NAD(P)H-dependent glycerol-3-phosphate dehydrogenase [Polaromonas sp.]